MRLDDQFVTEEALDAVVGLGARWPEPRALDQTATFSMDDRSALSLRLLDAAGARDLLALLVASAGALHEVACCDDEATTCSAMEWALDELGVPPVHAFAPSVAGVDGAGPVVAGAVLTGSAAGGGGSAPAAHGCVEGALGSRDRLLQRGELGCDLLEPVGIAVGQGRGRPASRTARGRVVGAGRGTGVSPGRCGGAGLLALAEAVRPLVVGLFGLVVPVPAAGASVALRPVGDGVPAGLALVVEADADASVGHRHPLLREHAHACRPHASRA